MSQRDPLAELDGLIACALAEDLGSGDITTQATVASQAQAHATITQKAPGVIFGLAIAEKVFTQTADGANLKLVRETEEGLYRDGGLVLMVEGSARAILTAERTALNFLQHLSGIATLTASYVAAIQGTGTKLLDTRKTTPGLRKLEKAAVLAGGGVNHRVGLYDAILIKENHVALAGGISSAVERVRKTYPGYPVEVECRALEELDEALSIGVDRVLLDNMSVNQVAQAVKLTEGKAELEVSGGVTLDSIRAFAETGVNFISVGAVTHSAPALDLSLTLKPV